jgi:hypothetical protein
MPDRETRRAKLTTDLAELRAKRRQARDDIRALPPPGERTAAQRERAFVRRYLMLLTGVVLNAVATPTDEDLDDGGVEG